MQVGGVNHFLLNRSIPNITQLLRALFRITLELTPLTLIICSTPWTVACLTLWRDLTSILEGFRQFWTGVALWLYPSWSKRPHMSTHGGLALPDVICELWSDNIHGDPWGGLQAMSATKLAKANFEIKIFRMYLNSKSQILHLCFVTPTLAKVQMSARRYVLKLWAFPVATPHLL